MQRKGIILVFNSNEFVLQTVENVACFACCVDTLWLAECLYRVYNNNRGRTSCSFGNDEGKFDSLKVVLIWI